MLWYSARVWMLADASEFTRVSQPFFPQDICTRLSFGSSELFTSRTCSSYTLFSPFVFSSEFSFVKFDIRPEQIILRIFPAYAFVPFALCSDTEYLGRCGRAWCCVIFVQRRRYFIAAAAGRAKRLDCKRVTVFGTQPLDKTTRYPQNDKKC